MSDPLDPLGLFADESSPKANSVKVSVPASGNDDGGLKKVNMDKYAVKGGSKTTAKPGSGISTVGGANDSSNGLSASNRGLGFGVAVTATTTNAAKLNSATVDVLDLLDKSAAASSSSASDALDDVLFGNSSAARKPTGNRGQGLVLGAGTGTGESPSAEDDMFTSFKESSSVRKSGSGTASAISSSSAGLAGSTFRTGLTSEDDHRISDLKASSQFLAKEDDQSLEYSMFGVSTAKQAVQKQNASLSNKAKAMASTLGSSGLDEASADLARVDSLSLDDETVFLQQKKAAAAAALTQDLFKGSKAPAAAAAEVDMSTLDLDAYLAANSGGAAGGGGGLFD